MLLGKRRAEREFYPNVWDIIGGHCLADEEPAQALVREVQEEINVTPITFRKVRVLSEAQPDIYGEREYHVYVITEWTGKGPSVLGQEHSQIRWFSATEARRLELAHPGYAELFESIQ